MKDKDLLMVFEAEGKVGNSLYGYMKRRKTFIYVESRSDYNVVKGFHDIQGCDLGQGEYKGF